MEHFLIATTMLVVGLFAVLSWDSTFPDRRDVLVLAPLPVRARTMFLAKVAAVGHGAEPHRRALCTALPASSGRLRLGMPAAAGLPAFYAGSRPTGSPCSPPESSSTAPYSACKDWPRKCCRGDLFLRVSSFLQLAAFCLFVCGYFLQPAFGGLASLTAPEIQRLLLWVPSYWFLGLFHQLNGSMHPLLLPLARRAWLGLAITTGGTAVAYTLSYLRTLRKIVEEPDITPGSRRFGWLPRFGSPLQNAIGQFSVRTLVRSRQHRVILAFYLGIGFALTIFLLKTPEMKGQLPGTPAARSWHEANTPLLAASIVMMALAVMGTRVVFALPLDLRANWIFRITGAHSPSKSLAAARRSLLLLSVMPVWLATAALCLTLWPWPQAAGHLALLGLLGILIADLCLHGFRKIPFTCSYLPGKSQVHMVFLGAAFLTQAVILGVKVELRALQDPP